MSPPFSIPRSLFHLACLVLVGVGVACGSGTAQPPQVEQQEAKLFLWQVQSPQNSLYLLGSVHFLKAENYPLPVPIQEAFDEAEGVVFEVDLRVAQEPASQRLLLQKAQPDSPGETLLASLSPETYKLAQAKASELGLPIALFHNFEPWFFTLSFLPLELQKLGFDAQYGVDQYFFNQAVNAQKEIIALESLDDQISLLDDLSASDQEQFLHQTLLELDTLETSLNNLVTAWSMGDRQELETLILDSFAPYPDLQDRLLTQRNHNWMGTIVPLLQQEEDYLVIVGAGHLVGAEGLLQLLQDQGYQLNQVSQPLP